MYKIYFAGDLFDQKHLVGNALFAQNIKKLSNGKYECDLPQDWEGGASFNNSVEIRNKDIASVIGADMVLYNFDGADLDSGTVVEFIVAKMLDIPAVLLRTDFRAGAYLFNQDWNLMVDGFPRSAEVKHSSIELYNELGLEKFQRKIATSVVDAFDSLANTPSLFKSYEEVFFAYSHVAKVCGSDLDKMITSDFLHALLDKKIRKGLYQVGPKGGVVKSEKGRGHASV